jgi:hypothetical protein
MRRPRASLRHRCSRPISHPYRLEKLDICLTVRCATVPAIASQPWHPPWIVPATLWRPTFATSGCRRCGPFPWRFHWRFDSRALIVGCSAGPSTTVRVVPLPRTSCGADAELRLATRRVRGLLTTTHREDSLPEKKRERSAERRIQPDAARNRLTSPSAGTSGAAAALSGRACLPALCCGSRQGFEPPTQLQAMLPGTWFRQALPIPLSQSRESTSRRGRRAAGRDARSRPAPEHYQPYSILSIIFQVVI